MSKDFENRDIIFDFNIRDKNRNIRDKCIRMLNRTLEMFTYSGLPDSIPQRFLEEYIQTKGTAVIAEAFYKGEKNLYCLQGNLSDVQDPYYQPTKYTVSNPALKGLVSPLTLGVDAVLIYNDRMHQGLADLFASYASRLVENEITIHLFEVIQRLKDIIASEDDETTESARRFYKKLEAGELDLITTNAFLDGVKPLGASPNASKLTDFIEYEQYIKASWFNDLGIRSNYNMKREAIMAGEAELDDDTLLPLIDNMYNSRKEWTKKVNEMFGTNIDVEYNSTWKNRRELNQIEIDSLKKELAAADSEEQGEKQDQEQEEKEDEGNK